MTKVTMPDPQLIVDFCENADLHVWEAGNERSAGVVRNASRGEYITTDQAEAYAEARVRGAIEEAAKICWEMQSAPEFGKDDKDHWLAIAERRIRALIPPTKNEAEE